MDKKTLSRFHSSYVVDESGCWVWISGFYIDGYGRFSIDGKQKRAHRVCYEMTHQITLNKNQFLHHICRNKKCINPRHLEITDQEHHVDSATYGNKDKTHCPHGHEYTPENTFWNRGGKARECRTCKYQRIYRKAAQLRQEKRKEAKKKLEELAKRCMIGKMNIRR